MVKRVLIYKTYFVKSWSYWCYLLENPSLSKTEFEQRNRDLMLTISAWWIRRPSGVYAVTVEKEKLSQILSSPDNSFCLIVTLCRLSLIASLSNQHILVSFLLIFCPVLQWHPFFLIVSTKTATLRPLYNNKSERQLFSLWYNSSRCTLVWRGDGTYI